MSSSTDLMIELHSDHARALWGFALRLTGGDRAWSLCSSIIRSVELDIRHLLPGETGRDAERFTARGDALRLPFRHSCD